MLNDEVKKWLRENYPHLIGNEELAMQLYNKKVLNKQIGVKISALGGYNFIRVSDLKAGVFGAIFFVVVEVINVSEFEVCAVCGRTNCTNPEHHGKKKAYATTIYGGDDSGSVNVSFFLDTPEDVEKIKSAEQMVICGAMKETKWGNKFIAKKWYIMDKVTANSLSEFVNLMDYAGAGGIKKDEVDKFLALHSELEPIFSNYIRLKLEGERVTW